MAFNLNDPRQHKTIASAIKDNVNAYAVRKFAEEPRKHLGISIIGKPCSRYIWNSYRWLNFESFEGRMLRLFNRGHLEEQRALDWLTGVGCKIYERDPTTGKQFKLSYHGGHYGGSCDGIGYLPPELNYNEAVLFEFKTHNQKKFDKVVKEGVKVAQPGYYRQMCAYGKGFGLKYGLYVGVNKNDDDIHFEFVELDTKQADADYLRAENIILSQTPPPKIAETPTFFDCRYCDAFRDICHNGKPPLKNCRSCSRARPVENAEWYCEVHNANIPENVIPNGCNSYARIV